MSPEKQPKTPPDGITPEGKLIFNHGHQQELPTDAEGTPFIPWELAETAGFQPGDGTATMSRLEEILAAQDEPKPLRVMKFGHPSNLERHYEEREGLKKGEAEARAAEARHNINNILGQRAERDGVAAYVLESADFVAGAEKLNKPSPEDTPVFSRHGAKMSPRSRGYTSHVPGDPKEYQPRISKEMGYTFSGTLRDAKDAIKESLPVRAFRNKSANLRGKLKRDPSKPPRRKF